MKELSQTIEMMLSADYKERFKAEYWQIKIRLEKLHKYIVECIAEDKAPLCTLRLLYKQELDMRKYLNCLEIRAKIDGIELEEV